MAYLKFSYTEKSTRYKKVTFNKKTGTTGFFVLSNQHPVFTFSLKYSMV